LERPAQPASAKWDKHMAKASTKKQKNEPLKAADFLPPKQLSQEQLSEICATLRISDRHAVQIKDFLDDLVGHIHDWMSREETTNRQRDRKRIEKMRKRIAAAQDELKGLGIDGRLAVRSAAVYLADIASGDWLRCHFPGEAPSRTSLMRGTPRGRDPDLERSNYQLHSNYQFIRHRAPETLQALLQNLESALASALTSIVSDPRARGGRQPLTYRHHVLVNLCEIWRRIGKTPVGTRDSDFSVFCELIFEAMGWPTDALDSAIPDARKHWLTSVKNRGG
jgi:hypothetical protein